MIQFDLGLARERRDEGIKRVAANNAEFLEEARKVAVRIARDHGTVTADDVRRYCVLVPAHPNAWGAVFKGKTFRWTGGFRQSEVVSRHGGMQRVWVLN